MLNVKLLRALTVSLLLALGVNMAVIATPGTRPVEVPTIEAPAQPQTPIVFDDGGAGDLQNVSFGGTDYEFPAESTDDEILEFLNQIPAEEEETKEPQEPFREEVIIKKDEGVKKNKEGKHVAYADSEGHQTGGRGHLLSKEEKKLYPEGTVIPEAVVKQWFKEDMAVADEDLTSILEAKKVHIPDEAFDVLLNMSFNLGKKRLLGFKRMWAAVEDEDWLEVSREMLLSADKTGKSLWWKQVGKRAERLARRMAALAPAPVVDTAVAP